MKQTIFPEYVNKLWPKLNLYVTERTNGSKKPRVYLHKQMLTPVYCPDQKWTGTSANTRYVAADMVAMDSPLPLKSRSSISKVGGKLPKVGMKKQMRESEINDILIMQSQLNSMSDESTRKEKLKEIYNRFINDGYACSVGIDERNEYNFLVGISEGIVLIESDEDDNANTGLGMRVNYGYKDENSFGVTAVGDFSGDDIDRVMTKADIDGNTPTVMMLSKTAYNNIRKTQWAKELVASNEGLTYTDNTKLPVPSSKKFNQAVEDEKGLTFLIVDTSIQFEKNGNPYTVKPFNKNKIIFLTSSENVGSLAWGTLAEAARPVNGINYSTVDRYKLISRYSVTDPAFAEFSKGQGLVLPVIEDVDSIYSIDLSDAQAVDTTAEASDSTDVKVTVWGQAYTKSNFVTELNKVAGKRLSATASDATIIRVVNELSDADEAVLRANVESYKAS